MKVEEAKNKICPFMGEYLHTGIYNCKSEGICITDRCMAWKWKEQLIKDGANREGFCVRLEK